MLTRKRLAARLASTWDLRLSIHTLAELGIGGVILEGMGEISPRTLSQTGRREVRALLRSAELELESLALPMRRSIEDRTDWDSRIGRLGEAMNLAYELGTGIVSLAPGPAPAADSTNQSYASHLSQLADLADHHGVIVALETGLEPAANLIQLLRTMKHPSLGVSFDPGRLSLSGESAEKIATDCHDMISIVYATDPEFMGLGNIGRGKSIDWQSVMELLEEVGYREHLTIWPDAAQILSQVVSEMGKRLDATPRF